MGDRLLEDERLAYRVTLCLLAAGDISVHFHDPDRDAVGSQVGHPASLDSDGRAISSPLHEFALPLAVSKDVCLNDLERLGEFRGEEDMAALAQSLVAGIAVHLLRLGVPVRDLPAEHPREDRIVRELDP